MKWYCALRYNVEDYRFQRTRLYEYRTSRDYDQVFSVFDGKEWITCDSANFDMYYLTK